MTPSATKTTATTKSATRPLLLRALAGDEVERPPAWLFRQAGRWLPEYRELRARTTFAELCATPELACEATLQPIHRFPFDAAIVFSDLLVPLEGFGWKVRHGDHGPELVDGPKSAQEAAARDRFEPNATVAAPARTLRLLARALPENVARIGFAGAPLTLALYLLEGRGAKGFERGRALALQDEASFGKLLEALAVGVADYVKLQVAGGAQVIQLFDSWGALLSCADWRRLVLPAARELVRRVRSCNVPVIWFVRGSADHAALALETGADAISVDWSVDLPRFARERAAGRAVQGNLDPALLLGPPELAAARATELKRAMKGRHGWLFNLGHGVTPDARIETVEALLEALRR
jgi:uroporphyrinogen decarboxylase